MITYEHSIGLITVWEPIKVVVTENKFLNGRFVGYNYFNLSSADSEEEGKTLCAKLKSKYELPRVFSSEESELFLVEIAGEYPKSEILKQPSPAHK